jgi:L-ribulose-5-phosphate 3-epimerase
MKNIISFMSANLIAQHVGWDMKGGWGQGHQAMEAHYRAEETFAERFEAMLVQVKSLGFAAIDLYSGHLGPSWATDKHITASKSLLEQHGFTVVSLAGGFGNTLGELERCCELARAVGAKLLSGSAGITRSDPRGAEKMLSKHGMVLAFENHPNQKSAADHLAMAGDLDPAVAMLAVDTGWFSTLGVNPAEAIRANASRVVHVHLKDVLPAGKTETPYPMKNMGHETCLLGEGIADIPGCLKALQDIGYTGPISIEHEPEDFNPLKECRISLQRLQKWMA